MYLSRRLPGLLTVNSSLLFISAIEVKRVSVSLTAYPSGGEQQVKSGKESANNYGRIGEVKYRPEANIDKIGYRSKPKAVDQIADGAPQIKPQPHIKQRAPWREVTKIKDKNRDSNQGGHAQEKGLVSEKAKGPAGIGSVVKPH